MANWWQAPITQAFNPPVEPGQDIGTAFHTPITALAPGTVLSESYGGFGARVDIKTARGDVYYQHLDEIASGLRPGSLVQSGQVIGLSGGQLYGGAHPNSPFNSTGPHMEIGLIGPNGQPVNPAALIAAGPQSAGIGSGGGSTTPTAPSDPVNSFFAGLQNAIIGGGNVIKFAGDPVGASQAAFTTAAGGAKSWVTNNIIPLVVAALIILVVLGTGEKTQTVNQPIPIPVPV